VAWSSFVPAPPTAGAGGTSISITMKVAGSFGQIFDYLRRLELLDRLIVVDGIQLAPGGDGGAPKIEANITARMFAAGTASPAAAPASAAPKEATDPDPATLVKAGG
jgi:Tfp pilus assembly protein PilO